jgi:sulfate adenylyltransferase subunit 1
LLFALALGLGAAIVALPAIGSAGAQVGSPTLTVSPATAAAGASVTLLLEEYLDISRGDTLSGAAAPATLLKQVVADVCWMSDEPLDIRRKYWIKHGTRQTAAKVTKVDTLLDINTQERHPADGLKLNDIARIGLTVQQPLAADAYADIRATGAYILIDEVTHQTVAAGMIRLGE